MTRRQRNNQWNIDIAAHPAPAPAPKNSECKNLLEKLSPRFFGNQTASSSLVVFQRARLSTRSITHLCWVQVKDILKEKRRAAEKSPMGSCSCTTIHLLTGHFATQKKLAYLGFQCLDHPPYSPDLALSIYHLFPGLRTNEV
jgi:hypothetical protein